MSQQLANPLAVNGMRFARDAGVLERELPVSELSRLHDLLAQVSGSVSFRLEGVKGERGQAQLRVQVAGGLPLACQRCLAAVPFALAIDSLLELVPEGTDLTQDELEDDSRDFLPVAGALDMAVLIEDEILLALPVVPRHEKCGLPGEAEAGDRINPFAALSSLKGRLN